MSSSKVRALDILAFLLDTGGRLRWNEAGDCVCYVNTEVHKQWMNQSTLRAKRQQAKEAAFIALCIVSIGWKQNRMSYGSW